MSRENDESKFDSESLFTGAKRRTEALKIGKEALEVTNQEILNNEILPDLDKSCYFFLKNEVPQVFGLLTDEILGFIKQQGLIKDGFRIKTSQKIDLVIPHVPDYVKGVARPARIPWVSEIDANLSELRPNIDTRKDNVLHFKDFFLHLWTKNEISKYVKWEIVTRSFPLMFPTNITKPQAKDGWPTPLNFEVKFNDYSNEGEEGYNRQTHGVDGPYLEARNRWLTNFGKEPMQNFIDNVYVDLDNDAQLLRRISFDRNK